MRRGGGREGYCVAAGRASSPTGVFSLSQREGVIYSVLLALSDAAAAAPDTPRARGHFSSSSAGFRDNAVVPGLTAASRTGA